MAANNIALDMVGRVLSSSSSLCTGTSFFLVGLDDFGCFFSADAVDAAVDLCIDVAVDVDAAIASNVEAAVAFDVDVAVDATAKGVFFFTGGIIMRFLDSKSF
jgi:hypothetical protein